MSLQEAFTFDDVLLVPQYSDLKSRSEANISTRIGALELDVPILSANMSCITGLSMARALGEAGGAGVLHRYETPEKIKSWIDGLVSLRLPAIPSVGVSADDMRLAKQYASMTRHICLDIAHGDSKNAVEATRYLWELGFDTIIAGNVCTASGAARLVNAGANVIKLGVGGGAACSTRGVTGHGYPQLSAVMEISRALVHNKKVTIIADGGLKGSGDIVKALAGGAHCVMAGSLFSGCVESEDKTGYYGMASKKAQLKHHGKVNNSAPEGAEFKLDESFWVLAKDRLEELAGGIRSGMSYSGARTLKELRRDAVFVRVSPGTQVESGTRNPSKR
jgi:IMP dehydrogenase